MLIEHIKENPDGSADMTVQFEPGEVTTLLQFAVVAILKEGIREAEKYQLERTGD